MRRRSSGLQAVALMRAARAAAAQLQPLHPSPSARQSRWVVSGAAALLPLLQQALMF